MISKFFIPNELILQCTDRLFLATYSEEVFYFPFNIPYLMKYIILIEFNIKHISVFSSYLLLDHIKNLKY